MATPTGTFKTIPGTPVTTIEGTDGGDVLGGVKINKNLRVNAKDGNDTLAVAAKDNGSLNAISVYGNAGNDLITTTSTTSGSLIQGGGGGDTIRVTSATTEVTVRGGSESDALTGVIGGTKLILNGNKHNDTMDVGNTFISSSIYGGDGDDKINVQDGILDATHIKGDKGNDTITDRGVDTSLTLRNGSKIYGNDGTDNINFAKTTTSLDIQGGAQNDTIVGGTVGDTLNGGADNDSINGGTGVDTISGSSGDDIITGDAGHDDLDGGIGNDTFNYGAAEFTTNEILNGGTGTNGIVLTADAQTLADANFANKTFIDTITTANGINSITLGTTAAATLTAGAKVTGGTAKDTINATALGEALIIDGGAGTNILIGSAKDDSITSGDGKDTITGLAGSDTITAGTAADTIIYTAKDQGGAALDAASTDKLAGGDTINGYLSGTDIINVKDALTGAAGAAAELAKDAVDFTSTGFAGVQEAATLDFVAGTTTAAAVATALGNVKGDANDVAYIGIMDADKDAVNVFQVFLGAANGTALALATGDTVAHVGKFNLTAASTMGDWLGTAVSA